jgi:ribonuclease J
VTRGFVDADESAELLEEAGRFLAETVEARSPEERFDPSLTRERVRQELRRFFRRHTQRRPMVIPVVMEI